MLNIHTFENKRYFGFGTVWVILKNWRVNSRGYRSVLVFFMKYLPVPFLSKKYLLVSKKYNFVGEYMYLSWLLIKIVIFASKWISLKKVLKHIGSAKKNTVFPPFPYNQKKSLTIGCSVFKVVFIVCVYYYILYSHEKDCTSPSWEQFGQKKKIMNWGLAGILFFMTEWLGSCNLKNLSNLKIWKLLKLHVLFWVKNDL